jgi:uncharacterized protein YgiM (DUF1202 family)
MKKYLFTMVCVMQAFLLSAQTFKYVNSNRLPMRSRPDSRVKVTLMLHTPARVEVLEVKGNWAKIKVKNKIGYVASACLVNNRKQLTVAKEEAFFPDAISSDSQDSIIHPTPLKGTVPDSAKAGKKIQ